MSMPMTSLSGAKKVRWVKQAARSNCSSYRPTRNFSSPEIRFAAFGTPRDAGKDDTSRMNVVQARVFVPCFFCILYNKSHNAKANVCTYRSIDDALCEEHGV